MISDWLKGSDENKERYSRARDLHEAFLMEAPIELLEGRETESAAKRRRVFRHVMAGVGYAAAFAVFCVLGYGIVNGRVENRLSETMNTIVVPAGKSMDYVMQDGTVIKLNSGARLQYPMLFSRDRREVRLDGEAFFTVSHDAERPFVVETFAGDIEVLGTEFNVNADKDNDMFSVTLAKGSVKVSSLSDPGHAIVMKPDEKVCMKDGRLELEQVHAGEEIRWTRGIIDIGGLEFDDLMKRLEMAYGVKIVIDRAVLPELRYTEGELRVNDGIEYALKVLQNVSDFTYSRDYSTGTIHIH